MKPSRRPAALVLAVLVAMGATACSRSEAPADETASARALGPGDTERGRKVFGSCRSCHAVEAGVNRVGPSLFGVVGRPAGAVADYSYSKAMAESGLVWDQAALDAYLENPRTHVPGTKMSFAGVSDPQARRDVVAYLATLK